MMEKLHLAICDDEAADRARTLELVETYDAAHQMKISLFQQAADLLERAQTEVFDIVLMDIEMQPLSGFEGAKQLCALPNPPVIIFTTKSSAYTLKGYGIAIRYLRKPLLPDTLSEALDAAIMEASAHRLTFQAEGILHAIPLRDVQYIEIFGHYIHIHTDKDSYRLRSTLKEVLSSLPKRFFVCTHKSYIVNLEHVRSATSSQVQLSCGTKIPIGRTKVQEFNQALYRFLGR